MKWILAVVAVCLMVAAAPMSASAQPGNTSVWMDDPNAPGTWPTEWNGIDPTALARLTRVGSLIDSSCNKTAWAIDFNIDASVGQWIKWSLSHQGWYLRIKKPGCYAGNSISFQIASNNDVGIDYQDFNDLHSVEGNAHIQDIATYYSWGESIKDAENNGWTSAADLNLEDDVLKDSVWNQPGLDLHEGITFKLWSKLCVVPSNTACEYHDSARIVLNL